MATATQIPTPLPSALPTAPLPSAAIAALSRLESAMSPADVAAHQAASYVRATACGTRTPRGLRTPTRDYMTCDGGHAPGDLHGARFRLAGWFSWSDGGDV